MPLEIKELHIKMSVNESKSTDSTISENSESTKVDESGLVSVCVEKVLEILKEKLER